MRRFEGGGSQTGGMGGFWIVRPGSTKYGAWRNKLRKTMLRYDFPFLSAAEIVDSL